ncbi:MAG TPA: hypothetical protein VG389_01920, partial [Myxococcota bacterium]|nr:hypothetical protein [Myxococcota bacterium]
MRGLDWAVVGAYAAASALFAVWFARRRRGAHSGEEYMVAGRRLPWWIVGIADVATADGADAFFVFTFFVGGFMGFHRLFWITSAVAFPLGVLWARYWRRLRLATPGQLYEERYGGRAAAGFRGVSAVYGALVNTSIVLAYVLKGFAQIMKPFLGWPDDLILLVFCGTTLLYTLLSGLLAVAYTDVVQFALMMVGRVVLAVLVVSAAGGMTAVLDRVETVRGAAFLQPYPPGVGAVYGKFAVDGLSLAALVLAGLMGVAGTQSATVQKSLAARDELHAAGGQILGTVLSLVVRLLPMTIVGLVAVAVFAPGRTDTDMWADLVRAHVGPGLLGLLLVGIAAGYMSTIDGFVNFAASGVLNDFFKRHVNPAMSERRQVNVGRCVTVAVMASAYLWARLLIANIDEAWINFINSVTGLFMLPLALLRWTWWRLNIWGEVVGFVGSFPLAYVVWFGLGRWMPAFKDRPYWQSFALLVGVGWGLILTVTWLTRPERLETLKAFYVKARPPGWWRPVAAAAGLDDGERRARAAELRHDVGTGAAGIVFAAALVVGMGAAFARRWGLCAATAAAATAAGVAFGWLTVGGERLRRRLGEADALPAHAAA